MPGPRTRGAGERRVIDRTLDAEKRAKEFRVMGDGLNNARALGTGQLVRPDELKSVFTTVPERKFLDIGGGVGINTGPFGAARDGHGIAEPAARGPANGGTTWRSLVRHAALRPLTMTIRYIAEGLVLLLAPQLAAAMPSLPWDGGERPSPSDEDLAQVLKEHNYDPSAAAKDRRIQLNPVNVRRRVWQAGPDDPLFEAQIHLSNNSRTNAPHGSSRRLSTGTELGDEVLAEVLASHNGSIKASAADPRLKMYPQALLERVQTAPEDSPLAVHREGREAVRRRTAAEPQSDEWIYVKLVEWELKGNVFDILTDPEVEITLADLYGRIRNAPKGSPLHDFDDVLTRRPPVSMISPSGLAYWLEYSGLNMSAAARMLGISQSTVSKKISAAPKFSPLGRIRFLLLQRPKR